MHTSSNHQIYRRVPVLFNLMLAFWCSSPAMAVAQADQPNRTDSQKAGKLTERTAPVGDDEVVVYKTVGEVEIKAWVKLPQGSGPFPVMIYIHGGGWLSAMAQGRPTSFSLMSAHMAKLGIAGVQIFYRGKQTVTINETAADVMDAVAWVRKNAANYNFDLTRLGLAGSSAGGHLAALVGQWTPDCVCVVSIAGVFDLPLLMAEWEDRHKGEADRRDPRTASHYGTPAYWGDEDNIRKHSPAHQLRPLPPKTLLVQGGKDATVPYEYAEQFLKQLRAKGGEAELKLFKDAPHRFHDIPKSPFYEPSMKTVETFLLKAFGLESAPR